MKLVKPTVEEILNLYDNAAEKWQAVQDEFRRDEQFYDLDFKGLLGLPKEFEVEGVVLPTGRDMVDASVSQTDVTNARIFVNKKGTAKINLEDAEMMRKFYHGMVYRTLIENSLSPWWSFDKHGWMHGLAVAQTVWDADRWLDKPERTDEESEAEYAERIDEWRDTKDSKLPIVIKAVNPHNVIPDPYENGGQFVFEVQEKWVYDVQKRWPKWGNPQSRKFSDKVKQISFWSKDWHCEFYDREPVLPVKAGVDNHRYGFIPYVCIDLGLGNITHDNDPVKRYVGALRYIRDVLISESRDYSIADIVLAKNAWPWGVIGGKGAANLTKLETTFGTWTVLPDDIEIKQMTLEVPPAALQQHLAITASYITAHAAPNAVRGMGEQGVRSAADRRQIMAQAATRYSYASEAIRHGTEKILINCARVMKNVIPGDMRLWAKTPTDEFDVEVKKDRMKEPFTCYVEFAPVSEEDEYRRDDGIIRLMTAGVVTKQWARQQKSNVDAVAMAEDEEYEALKANPMVQELVGNYVRGRLMQALTKRSKAEGLTEPPPPMAPEEMQGEGMGGQESSGPPRRMIAPVPEVVAPGSAQALQNGLRNMRSKVGLYPNQGVGGGGNNP